MSTANPTNRCPVCLKWFASQKQQAVHAAKQHLVMPSDVADPDNDEREEAFKSAAFDGGQY